MSVAAAQRRIRDRPYMFMILKQWLEFTSPCSFSNDAHAMRFLRMHILDILCAAREAVASADGSAFN